MEHRIYSPPDHDNADIELNSSSNGSSGFASSLRERPSCSPDGATLPGQLKKQPSSLAQRIGEIDVDIDDGFSDETLETLWDDAGVLGIIKKMDKADKWAVDGPGGHELCAALSRQIIHDIKKVADAGNEGLLIDCSDDITRFLGHLKTSRSLAFFRWLVERSPSFAVRLIQDAASNMENKEKALAALLFERIQVLERSRILSRVFSPERIASLIEVIDDNNQSSDFH